MDFGLASIPSRPTRQASRVNRGLQALFSGSALTKEPKGPELAAWMVAEDKAQRGSMEEVLSRAALTLGHEGLKKQVDADILNYLLGQMGMQEKRSAPSLTRGYY